MSKDTLEVGGFEKRVKIRPNNVLKIPISPTRACKITMKSKDKRILFKFQYFCGTKRITIKPSMGILEPGKKIACKISIASIDKTITDKEVEKWRLRVVGCIVPSYGVFDKTNDGNEAKFIDLWKEAENLELRTFSQVFSLKLNQTISINAYNDLEHKNKCLEAKNKELEKEKLQLLNILYKTVAKNLPNTSEK